MLYNVAMSDSDILVAETTPKPAYRNRISDSQIIELHNKNFQPVEIAKILKCSRANISKRLKNFKEIENYGQNADYYFEKLQKEIIDSIDEPCIKKAGLQSKVWAIAVLEDKKRLIRGKSTQNISIRAAIMSLSKDIATKNVSRGTSKENVPTM